MNARVQGIFRAARQIGPILTACWRAWLLAAAAYAFARFQGSAVSWFLCYTAMLLAAYGTALALVGIAFVRVRRARAELTGTAGERLEVVLEVERGWLPLPYLLVEDDWPPAWRRRGNPSAFLLPGFRRRLRIPLAVDPAPRGEVHLSAVTLRTGDWFGLVRVQRVVPLPGVVRVYPRVWTSAASLFCAGPLRGHRRSGRRLRSEAVEVAGVRPYQPGDPPVRLHWKLSAHRGQLLTKRFALSPDHEEVVVVFNRAAHDYRPNDEARFEAAVSAAASMVVGALAARRKVTFVSGNPACVWALGPQEAAAHRRLLDHLLTVAPDENSVFAHTLREVPQPLGAAHWVVITPRLDGEALSLLRRLAARGEDVVVCWVPPAGLDAGAAADGVPGSGTAAAGERRPAALAALAASGIPVFRTTERGLVRLPVGGGVNAGGQSP